jgi:hypothetical protein
MVNKSIYLALIAMQAIISPPFFCSLFLKGGSFLKTCGGIPQSFIYKIVHFYIPNQIMHFYHGHYSYLLSNFI